MTQIDWDALSRVIDVFSSEEYAPILHEFYPWMVDRLDDRGLEPGTFVDVGCGTGLLSAKLLDWYPDARLVLVDESAAMLDRARERMGDRERVSFVGAAAAPALGTLEPGSVDAMIFCRSWYALPEPEKVAARAVEVLAPGGLVFLFDFTREIDIRVQDEFYAHLEPERWPDCRVLTLDFAEGIAQGRYRVYDEEQMAALWRDAGAELVAYESHEPQFPNHRMCFEKAGAR